MSQPEQKYEKTIFNLLIIKTAGALKQNIGVFDKKWIIPITKLKKTWR